MANDLTGPVWIIDTPATLYTKLILVKGIRWVSKAAVMGDDVEIKDGAGHVIWTSIATGPNYVEADSMLRIVEGLVVSVLDSGKLYLELR